MIIISKQLACQKFIFKIHSSRLRKAKWKLTLPIAEARNNEEVISLADSQVLRWIDEVNNFLDGDQKAREIKSEIKRVRKEPESLHNRRLIRSLYEQLDQVQFKPDYMCLIIDKEKDYYRACNGFSINGIQYRRLLGTNGGVKNSTIVFVSDRVHGEISRRIDNGRDMTKELVPAKLEAYKALSCSASIPVSMPNGILIVNDCETKFLADTIYLNDEDSDEPVMEERLNTEVVLNGSDGCGMMSPALAARWSQELGLDYLVSGVNTRFAWEKGMVFTFDFHEFADTVANSHLVKDAWGNVFDIRQVELILTTSMVKLWDSYKSCDDYIANCLANKYTFGIAKTCPRELENQRTLNYQFIQSYHLDDDALYELVKPTLTEIEDVIAIDRMKSILFLKGEGLTEDNVVNSRNDFTKALMVEPELMNDSYVRNRIYNNIKKRIDKAKVGVLNVHGNYSIVCGDPYALCQSIFGLEVTGILGEREIYNEYWANGSSDELVCFRAPMTCMNNIRRVFPNRSQEARHWFQYIRTGTILNVWGTECAALNGMDFDGDLVMLTDNRVLSENLIDLPALMCVQRKAKKKIVTEEDAIQSNIASFGDDIGKTTNWITSMFDVQSKYQVGSPEYEELDYRIKCGQLFQQNAIDKSKGIIAKPMPAEWHDRHAVNQIEDPEMRKFYQRILADKKPYFMRLIYPDLSYQYNTYIKNTNKNSMRKFNQSMQALLFGDSASYTEEQKEFVKYYKLGVPVGTNDCVMNRICRMFEDKFNGYIGKQPVSGKFDYTILKSGAEYSKRQYDDISKLYDAYIGKVRRYVAFTKYERVDVDDAAMKMAEMDNDFLSECLRICSNKSVLCDIMVDICYKKNSTKSFVWSFFADEIVDNLLARHNGEITFPVKDQNGDIVYNGDRFTEKKQIITIGVDL